MFAVLWALQPVCVHMKHVYSVLVFVSQFELQGLPSSVTVGQYSHAHAAVTAAHFQSTTALDPCPQPGGQYTTDHIHIVSRQPSAVVNVSEGERSFVHSAIAAEAVLLCWRYSSCGSHTICSNSPLAVSHHGVAHRQFVQHSL